MLDYETANKYFFIDSSFQLRSRIKRGSLGKGEIAGKKRNAMGRRIVKVDNKVYRAEDIAYLLYHRKWPERPVEFADGLPYNFRKSNLILSDRSSRYAGVSRHFGRLKQWRARVYTGGDCVEIGYFTTEWEANTARLTYMRQNGISKA